MGYIDMLLCLDAKILFESNHSLFWSFLLYTLIERLSSITRKMIQPIKIIKDISSTKILSL